MRHCEIVEQGVATLIRELLSEYKRYSGNKTSSRERQAVPRTKVRRAAEGLLAIGFSLSDGNEAEDALEWTQIVLNNRFHRTEWAAFRHLWGKPQPRTGQAPSLRTPAVLTLVKPRSVSLPLTAYS